MDNTDKIYISGPREPIENWQKDYSVDGVEEFSGQLGDVSLYSYNLAKNSFPIGSYVDLDDLLLVALENEMALALSKMVDDGFCTMSWDESKEAIIYNVTAKGEKYMDTIKKENDRKSK